MINTEAFTHSANNWKEGSNNKFGAEESRHRGF